MEGSETISLCAHWIAFFVPNKILYDRKMSSGWQPGIPPRLARAATHVTNLARRCRKYKRLVEKCVEEKHIEEEGTTYCTGEF